MEPIVPPGADEHERVRARKSASREASAGAASQAHSLLTPLLHERMALEQRANPVPLDVVSLRGVDDSPFGSHFPANANVVYRPLGELVTPVQTALFTYRATQWTLFGQGGNTAAQKAADGVYWDVLRPVAMMIHARIGTEAANIATETLFPAIQQRVMDLVSSVKAVEDFFAASNARR